MVKNLPVWFFLAVALLLIGAAQLPLLRFAMGIDTTINMAFTTVVVLLIGGLMSGLSAMILLVRRAPTLNVSEHSHTSKTNEIVMHGTGLLLYTGIPLLNFLAAYWWWSRVRHQSQRLNLVGRNVLNFQITIYLYLLLSLFMVFAAIGLVTTPLILLLHLIATLLAMVFSALAKDFNYPANIPIIQGRRPTPPLGSD